MQENKTLMTKNKSLVEEYNDFKKVMSEQINNKGE